MRIIVMSDIHGNAIALNAVLDDIVRQGNVDEYWILGDIVEAGPAPVEVLERLAQLSNVRYVRGNTDRYVSVGGSERFFGQGDPASMNLEAAGAIAWTQGAVTHGGWFDWLAQLPLEINAILPDGTKVLGVHAAPGRDAGLGFKVGLTEAELSVVLGDCTSDLILGGHHHRPLDVVVNGKRVVNVGSVSLPFPPDLRASYVVLDANSSSYHIEHRRVEYDREAVITALEQLRHPGARYSIAHLRGLRQPSGAEFIQPHMSELRKLAEERASG